MEELCQRVVIDEVGDIDRFLARETSCHCHVWRQRGIRLTWDHMLRTCYKRLPGRRWHRNIRTIHLQRGKEAGGRGPSTKPPNALMKLIWISRLLRPNLLTGYKHSCMDNPMWWAYPRSNVPWCRFLWRRRSSLCKWWRVAAAHRGQQLIFSCLRPKHTKISSPVNDGNENGVRGIHTFFKKNATFWIDEMGTLPFQEPNGLWG